MQKSKQDIEFLQLDHFILLNVTKPKSITD